jgi:hypothetical protein
MATKLESQLARITQEIERQNAEWAHAKHQLAALGDVRLFVPEGLLADIDEACAPLGARPEPTPGIRA